MKKNEKFLALLLSVVMILTCFVGTVTVNAENATPTATIVVTADAVEVGATEIPVTLTVTSETGINEALIKVSSDLGDIIAQPTVEANTPADADNTEGAANYNAFYLSARNVDDGTGNTTLGAITTATIKVVFTRTEAIVAGTYNVDVEIPEGKVIAASKDEVAIDLVCDGLEIVVAEAPAEPECEHVNYTFVSGTPASYDAVSYTETAKGEIVLNCSDCGENFTKVVNYFTQYAIAYTAADYSVETCLVLRARIDHLTKQGNYQDAFCLVNHTLADGTPKATSYNVSEAIDANASNGKATKTWSYPLKSTQYADEVTAYVFVKYGNEWYSGISNNYGMEQYALTAIKTVKETEKVLIANMLNYGAKAQLNFGYNTEHLATANLGEYASYITTEEPEIAVQDYCDILAQNYTTGVYVYTFNLDMASKTTTNIKFRSNKYTGTNKDDYKVVVSWLNKAGEAQSYTYSKDGSEADDAYSVMSGYTDRFEFNFAQMKSTDYRRKFTVDIFDGDTNVNGSYSTSFECMIAEGIANNSFSAKAIPMYKAMMNYGDAAVAHFG